MSKLKSVQHTFAVNPNLRYRPKSPIKLLLNGVGLIGVAISKLTTIY